MKLHTNLFISGVSGAFLADIKPQTDGCNGLKYNLTSDIIECIFKTYPAVKRKHIDNVPSKYTESEFWTKFFQSHYFHRDRINTGTKDIFAECGKIDDQNLKQAVEKSLGDPLLDIKTFNDNPVGECYGGGEQEKVVVNSGNIVHQSMIKRFNQHSIMVLNTSVAAETGNLSQPNNAVSSNGINNNGKSDNKNDGLTNGMTKHKHNHDASSHNQTQNSNNLSNENGITSSPKTKRARILEKINYNELLTENEKNANMPQLSLTKVCYFSF